MNQKQVQTNVNFVKMHGLGNDFIIINIQDLSVDSNHNVFAKFVADRHIGIGCDQLIIYEKIENNHYNMSIYNQDGSVANACGNAMRCLMYMLYNKFGITNISINVLTRQSQCIINNEEICVNMGSVSFNETWMPSTDKLWDMAQIYSISPKEILCVDVGNPHLIIFANLNEQDQNIIAQKIQSSNLFPQGININFANINNHNTIYLSVWERGTGLTLACGSGACASFAASQKLGFIGSCCEVSFKLGKLKMSMQEQDIIMCGSATFVAAGTLYY